MCLYQLSLERMNGPRQALRLCSSGRSGCADYCNLFVVHSNVYSGKDCAGAHSWGGDHGACTVQAVQSQQEARLSLADFLCAKPGCTQLLRDPVVLNCGCCVCMSCRPALGGSCPRCGAISVTTAFVCSKVSIILLQALLCSHLLW